MRQEATNYFCMTINYTSWPATRVPAAMVQLSLTANENQRKVLIDFAFLYLILVTVIIMGRKWGGKL